jgi:hypothetical protein
MPPGETLRRPRRPSPAFHASENGRDRATAWGNTAAEDDDVRFGHDPKHRRGGGVGSITESEVFRHYAAPGLAVALSTAASTRAAANSSGSDPPSVNFPKWVAVSSR